ncbi:hypothetical protein ACFFJT_01430 [Dyella flava]|uniref:Uncharacterized protein n=1 Tax=Dyella flava TaxID=1920170 RepID=A0ABS2K6F3_9GAMM|nr:hypothetical protein [Dyella flava]MBM7126342.1 hypothetical protein [Dyella flava]
MIAKARQLHGQSGAFRCIGMLHRSYTGVSPAREHTDAYSAAVMGSVTASLLILTGNNSY